RGGASTAARGTSREDALHLRDVGVVSGGAVLPGPVGRGARGGLPFRLRPRRGLTGATTGERPALPVVAPPAVACAERPHHVVHAGAVGEAEGRGRGRAPAGVSRWRRCRGRSGGRCGGGRSGGAHAAAPRSTPTGRAARGGAGAMGVGAMPGAGSPGGGSVV